jgi:thioredoxin reductase (NADPH)
MHSFDIIVVGGGMAGLSAAFYGAWLGRKVMLAERQMFGGQLVNAATVENYPGFADPVPGADLVAHARMQAMRFGAEMEYVEITSIESRDAAFLVRSAETVYESPTVIVATGGRGRRLKVKGEVEFEGRGVSYCATCDGAFFAEKPVVVVGGGDSALEEALYLANIASRVTLVHRGSAPIGSTTLIARAKEKTNIEWLAEREIAEIRGNDSVEELRLNDGSLLSVRGVFIAIGCDPETSLLEGLADLGESGHAVVDLQMQTSVPGLFAAGAVRQASSGQLASVVGDGVTAAVACHARLAQVKG